MSFSSRLKELRLRSGKSLQEVADVVGASKAHLWELEAGRSKNPSFDLLKKLSDYFKVSVSTLIGEDPDDTRDTNDEQLMVLFRQIKELGPEDRELLEKIIQHQKMKKSDGAKT
jgi:transcriptional regulator with XRE-family HTH domain